MYLLKISALRYLLLLITISSITPGLAAEPPLREFRGIWIATINNIDWPSSPALSVEDQKKELRELIEHIGELNLNTVILQVRPAGDAFYPSDTEPWSLFLTGKQGLAPTAPFDPLQYAIDLCHANCMQLHAWFNPFRVRNIGYYQLDPRSFAAQHPQYTRVYDNKLFLDPGIPQVRSHLVKVIMEVVRKYDIDAVHFDDYFYPYPVAGKKFPDLKTFRQYGKEFYPERQNDWRRENINRFIAEIHDSIKSVKPSLRLGVSPFGIWRNERDDPNGSPGARGTTSYDDLFADVCLWLSNGWIDYVIPQLYWEQGNRFGDFAGLAQWWNNHSYGKPLYLGQALYKTTGGKNVFTNPNEISEQIAILRKFSNVKGFALYSASHLAKLSETAINDLRQSLKPADIDNTIEPSLTSVTTAEQGQIVTKIVSDSILISNKKSLPGNIRTRIGSTTSNKVPVPQKLSVTKYSQGWEISWEISSDSQINSLNYTVTVFEPAQRGKYKQKIYQSSELKKIFIPRKGLRHPSGTFFMINSTDTTGGKNSQPVLFRISGRRIRFL